MTLYAGVLFIPFFSAYLFHVASELSKIL